METGEVLPAGAGDALGFDSTADHTYRNAGDERVTGLVINYYPG
ncbi:MAG: cupin domain-containing protein [Evtepia gabavorous]